MPNQLKNEKSPYLKQHENNPVNWLPLSIETLIMAKNEKKTISGVLCREKSKRWRTLSFRNCF